MKTTSQSTGRTYEPETSVFIVNIKQSALYIKHGATILDIMWSREHLVFVFDRAETYQLYDLWCKRELV